MATLCPTCRTPLQDDDINVAKDTAFCRECDKAFALSDLVHGKGIPDADLTDPPPGAWYRDDGVEVVVGATCRNIPAALFMAFFATFWNSITWTFVILIATGSSNVNGPGISHANGQTVISFVAFVFMIPFVLVGLLTAALALFSAVGRLELTVKGTQATLFRGIGPIGRHKHFDLSTVTKVSLRRVQGSKKRHLQQEIVLDGADLRFGSSLTKERREFIAGALKDLTGV